MRHPTRSTLLMVLSVLAGAACQPGVDDFGTLDPTGCVRCHGGTDEATPWLQPGEAHPAIAGLTDDSCHGCHGGDPNSLVQGLAHESMQTPVGGGAARAPALPGRAPAAVARAPAAAFGHRTKAEKRPQGL